MNRETYNSEKKKLFKLLKKMPKDLAVALLPEEYSELQHDLRNKAIVKVTAVPIKKGGK